MRRPSFPTLRPLTPPDKTHVQDPQEVASRVHAVRGHNQVETVAVLKESRSVELLVFLVQPEACSHVDNSGFLVQNGVRL